MVKWIDEKVLQYYFKENASKYSIKFGEEEKPIERCQFNIPFDAFPDLISVANGKEVPIEVEWLTSKYDHNKRTPEKHQDFLSKEGVIVVYEKDAEIAGAQQIVIDHKDFKNWFKKNAAQIFDDSVKAFEEEVQASRQYKKIWLIYIGRDVEKNLQVGRENGIWGFTDKRFQMRSPPIIKQIKKNDVVLFLGPTKDIQTGNYHSGRDYAPDKYYKEVKKNSNLIINRIVALKISQDYWNEILSAEKEKRHYKPVWPDETEENRKYPHRFLFNKTPIVEFSDVQMNKITKSTIETLRKLMIGDSPQDLDSSDFVELISNVSV